MKKQGRRSPQYSDPAFLFILKKRYFTEFVPRKAKIPIGSTKLAEHDISSLKNEGALADSLVF